LRRKLHGRHNGLRRRLLATGLDDLGRIGPSAPQTLTGDSARLRVRNGHCSDSRTQEDMLIRNRAAEPIVDASTFVAPTAVLGGSQ
jgi:hypothetical protein